MRNSGDCWKVILISLLILAILCDSLTQGSRTLHFRNSQEHSGPSGPTEEKVAEEVATVLESGFLKKMGMASRPRPERRIPIPEHLTELYETMMAEHDENTLEDNDFHYEFDSAKSFFPEDLALNESANVFHFTLEGFRDEEYLESAELRLNIQEEDSEERSEESSHSAGRFRVNIYERVRQHSVLLDSQIVDCGASEQWLSLDMSGAAERWRRSRGKSGSVQVEIISPRSGTDCTLNLNYRQLTSSSPVLILYTNDYEDSSEPDSGDGLQSRTKRATTERRRHGRRKKQRRHRHHRGRKTHSRQNLCRKEALYVDFDKVGWNDWIFAPPGYHAYYCSGECPFPLSSHMNASNHAVIQTLINAVSPGIAPKACCVPTDLSPISLLYLNEFEKVVLRNYQDMVVQGCGCR